MKKPQRAPIGTVTDATDKRSVARFLDELGPDGGVARALDDAVSGRMTSVASLSQVTDPLALDYLERIHRPLSAMDLSTGAFVLARGYVAHMAVETDGFKFGVDSVPVIGALPPIKKGRLPTDLLMRVVKATRRQFGSICALSAPTWEGFVVCTTWRTHSLQAAEPVNSGRDGAEPAGRAYVSQDVVDGLVRVGWVLRQVDLNYGFEPESGGSSDPVGT